jgi:hypothetical protein
MRLLLCLISTWSPIILISAQAHLVPLSLTSTAGSIGETVIKGNTRSLEWSIGEVIIGSGNSDSYVVTHGEQQGLKNALHVGITKAEYSRVNVYPNPASQFISIDKMPDGIKMISLHNYLGYPFFAISTDEGSLSIPTALLPSGFYLLTIQSESHQALAYKISILQH